MGRCYHTSSLISGNRILVTGGVDCELSKSCEIYDINTNTWTKSFNLIRNREAHCAVVLNSGKVLVAGGGFRMQDTLDWYSYTNTGEYFNGLGWYSAANFISVTKSGLSGVLLNDGRAFLSGGIFGTIAETSCDTYDESTNSFSPAASLNVARAFHTSHTLSNGLVIAIAGSGDVGNYVDSIEIYDPNLDTWSVFGTTLTNGVIFHASVLIDDGIILISGGSNGAPLNDCYIYDYFLATLTPVSSMNQPRAGHTSTLITNGINAGKVLVTGGFDSTDILKSAELYDPLTNTWTLVGTMYEEAWGHSSFDLGNGDILNFAGQVSWNNYLPQLTTNSTQKCDTDVTIPNIYPSFSLITRMTSRDYACAYNNAAAEVSAVMGGETIYLTVGNTPLTITLGAMDTSVAAICSTINSASLTAGIDNLYAIPVFNTTPNVFKLISVDKIFTGSGIMSYADWQKIGLPQGYLSDPAVSSVEEISVPYISNYVDNSDSVSNIQPISDHANRVTLYIKFRTEDNSSSHPNHGWVVIAVLWDNGGSEEYLFLNGLIEPFTVNNFNAGNPLVGIDSQTVGLTSIPPNISGSAYNGVTQSMINLEPPPGSTGIRIAVFTGDPSMILNSTGDFQYPYIAPKLSLMISDGTR